MLGLELLLVQWVFVRRHVLASTIGNGFSFVAVVEVISVLLMVASVTLLTVAIAVIAILLVMFGLVKCVVGLLLKTRIRVTILWEITLLILLLVVLGELIWVAIIVWLLLAIMGCS
jgi:hypothetical protein